MTYLLLIPCMFVVYLRARELELSGASFALILLLLTVIFDSLGFLAAGADTLVATCLTMVFLSVAQWDLERQWRQLIGQGVPSQLQKRPGKRFCASATHDFAVHPHASRFAISLIAKAEWAALDSALDALDATERQAFFANLDYSQIAEPALEAYLDRFPRSTNAHVLAGHVKLCSAKRLGLVPGETPDEHSAAALVGAFKHFRLALRIDDRDAEAMCGLLMAKGYIALREDQLEDSLQRLLSCDPNHLHGLLAAARFLIRTPQSANRFVSLVQRCSAGGHLSAVAPLIAHVECISQTQGAINSSVIADLYRQLRAYDALRNKPSGWQSAIASNIIAYAFAAIGDKEEEQRHLSVAKGAVSAYPWKLDAQDDKPVKDGRLIG